MFAIQLKKASITFQKCLQIFQNMKKQNQVIISKRKSQKIKEWSESTGSVIWNRRKSKKNIKRISWKVNVLERKTKGKCCRIFCSLFTHKENHSSSTAAAATDASETSYCPMASQLRWNILITITNIIVSSPHPFSSSSNRWICCASSVCVRILVILDNFCYCVFLVSISKHLYLSEICRFSHSL